MLSVRKETSCPDYSLCNETVTLYHRYKETDLIERVVIENGAFFGFNRKSEHNKIGSKESSEQLLVIPQSSCRYVEPQQYKAEADTYTLSLSDKVFIGTGPEITTRDEWSNFIPAINPKVFIVNKLNIMRINNKICHVEAG